MAQTIYFPVGSAQINQVGSTFNPAIYNQAASQGTVAGPVAPSNPYNAVDQQRRANSGQQVLGQATSTTGGGNSHINPATGQWDDNYFASQNQANNDLINQIYGSAMNDISNQENTLRSNQQSILGDINSAYGSSTGTLQSNLNQSNAQLDQSAQQGGQRQQDALTAARRLYGDLIQGGQQRFGGASSAGEAYQALTGRELQRNSQQITSQYNDFMGQVSLARSNVQSKYDDAISQLEQQRNSALNQANRDFQDKLSQINSLRNQAASDKASAQLSALQELRNQIYNINIATSQNSQALNTYKTQAETQLQTAISQFTQSNQNAGSALTAYGQNTTTNPTTGLAIANTGGGVPTYNPVGQANPQDTRKDQYGFNFA